MDLENIKLEVIHTQSATRLFELMVDLSEEVSRHHILLVKTEDIVGKAEIKGKISILSTLQNIIDKRLEEVRVNEKENERKELISNRQFKLAAEAVLQKETYEKIKEYSFLNYKKFRDIKADLKANKIE